MSKKFMKSVSVAVMLLYLFLISGTAAYAKPSDISRHWAAASIENWLSKGVLKEQPAGKFRPDDAIKRIEFIAMINSIFNYTDKSENKFADVIAGSDNGAEVAKAIAAGYIKADRNNKIYPSQALTRVDAVDMLAKVFELEVKNTSEVNKYSDMSKIPSASRDAVSAFTEKGFIAARSDGSFSPYSNVTRAETAVMLDKIMSGLFNSSGTYKLYCTSNAVVNTKDVTLKDTTVDGDLYITEGVGDGDVTLDNVTVKGRTIIRGGGRNSIIIRNSRLAGNVIVSKKDGKIRLVAEGMTTVSTVRLNSGAILEEYEVKLKGFDSVELLDKIPYGQEIRFDGEFGTVNVYSGGARILTDGSIARLDIKKESESMNIRTRSGIVKDLNIDGPKTVLTVDGGLVNSLRLGNTAKGSAVGIAAVAKVSSISNSAGASVKGSSSVSSSSSSSLSLTAYDVSVAKGRSRASNVSVTSGCILSYVSMNPEIAYVDSDTGRIYGIEAGQTQIQVTASKQGYASVYDLFTVTVTGDTIGSTATGYLSISPQNSTEGAADIDIALIYYPGEALANGTVVFSLPSGFRAQAGDQVKTNMGDVDPGQVSYSGDGSKVTVTGLYFSYGEAVALILKERTIPAAGSYSFYATADADGFGTLRTPSAGTGNERVYFTSGES
ncbi:S-layer family protein [Anaerobacterium chartisolvens]|uniref:S-layer family protein n=1 Tax=Anaerobacterium chartisolvens TaxID=1297424 RepID=A0A369BHG2_9FIRM|nr:BslA/BslB family hydrophobin [Anaerobacterium chartisolvens]RCX20999.1 S-layer family protein [Anaerobacterium chartisolvens]